MPVLGGKAAEGAGDGFFIEPTIIADGGAC